MAINTTQLRANLYKLLDQVIETEVPLDIIRQGHKLQIVVKKEPIRGKIANLESHPDTIVGDPESLVYSDWISHWDGDKEL